MPSPFQEVVVYGETFNGFTSEIGRSSGVRLSTMGVSIPTILYEGSYCMARGNGGPLHVHLPDWKTPVSPMPTILPSLTSSEKYANLIIACLTHMMGGAVTIQPHEIEHARNLTLEAENLRDPFMIRIKAL